MDMARGKNISAARAAQAGLVAITASTSLLVLGNRTGLLHLHFGRYLGTLLLPLGPTALLVGWMLHFLHGVLFAIPYAILFNQTKTANRVRDGALIGFGHAIIGLLTLVLLGKVHPRPEQAQVEPFRPTSYGLLTIPGMVGGHILYGAIVGWFLQRRPSRKERRRFLR